MSRIERVGAVTVTAVVFIFILALVISCGRS